MVAETSRTRFAYVAEVTPGVTPATPSFKVMRVTGAGLAIAKSTVESEEIQADRNVRDDALTGIDVAGAYGFELSYGSMDDFFESAFRAAWSTNVLKNGVTPKTFTVEETLDLGATDSFSRFRNVEVNTLSLSLAGRGKITGSFGMMARDEALDDTIITGATYTAANTKPMLTASAHVANLSIAGIASPRIKEFSLELNNNMRTRPEVGSVYSEDFGTGKASVKGSFMAYFTSNALYQKVLNHEGGAITFTLGAATGDKYTVLLPNVRFGDGKRQLGGVNDDVMLPIPFTALYDPTEDCTVKLTRAVA